MAHDLVSDKKLEQSILAAIMTDSRVLDHIGFVMKEMFFDTDNRNCFVAIYKLHEEGKPIDRLTVSKQLQKVQKYKAKDANLLTGMMDHTLFTQQQVVSSSRILHELWLRRQAQRLGQELSNNALDNSHDILEVVDKANSITTKMQESITMGQDIVAISLTEQADKERHLLKLGQRIVLNRQELMCLVARPGAGKSRTCEAVAAGWLNKEADALGFHFMHTQGKLLYIDTERSRNDCIIGMKTIRKRVGEAQELYEGTMFKNMVMFNFKEISDRKERQRRLKRLLDSDEFGMVILDGSTDFIYDPNDAEEGNKFIDYLVKIAVEKNLGILNTIHDNPGQSSAGKARGHFGSELLRKSQSVLYLKKDGDSSEKIITTQFDYGKNRDDKDDAEGRMKWSDEMKMFVSATKELDKHHASQLILQSINNNGSKKINVIKYVLMEYPRHKDDIESLIDEMAINGDININGGIIKKKPRDGESF